MIELSVVIPTLDRSEELRGLLTALRKQSLGAELFEVIVVDNSQFQSSSSLCAEFSGVRYVAELNTGLHFARHSGAKAAFGRILVFCDDDILPSERWLEELLRAFNEERIAAVGGKAIGLFEDNPPDWLAQFGSGGNCPALSLLDLADRPIHLEIQMVYGCNLAIIKDVLFKVGGFNPDYFNSPFEQLSGDGECGLLNKIRRRGYQISYSPTAWVYHKVPKRRLTSNYFIKRFERQGIARVYTCFRESHGSFGRMALLFAYAAVRRQCLKARIMLAPSDNVFLRMALISYCRSICIQIKNVYRSRALQRYILQSSYFNDTLKTYESIAVESDNKFDHRFT